MRKLSGETLKRLKRIESGAENIFEQIAEPFSRIRKFPSHKKTGERVSISLRRPRLSLSAARARSERSDVRAHTK